MASNTVGTTGDYSTQSAWEAARQSSTENETCVLLDEDHTGGLSLSGWSDQTVTITFRGEVAQDGDPTSGPRIGLTSSYEIDTDNPLIWEDLGFYEDTGLFCRYIEFSGDGTTELQRTFRRCTVYELDSYASALYSDENGEEGGKLILIENCLFVRCNRCVMQTSYNGGPDCHGEVRFVGCTLYASSIAYQCRNAASDMQITVNGCLITPYSGLDDIWDEDGSGIAGTLVTDSTDCIAADADHATNWGANGTVTNETDGVTFNNSGTPGSGEVSFTDATNNDYSLVDHANNIALAYVTNATLSSTDILGVTRDATPDCGAFEVVTSSSAVVEPDTALATATGYAPEINNPQTLFPGTATATGTRYTPDVSNPKLAFPGTAEASGTLYTPTISNPKIVTPDTALATAVTYEPEVNTGVLVTPDTALATAVTYAPEISNPKIVTPDTAEATAETYTPEITLGAVVTPDPAEATGTLFTPTITVGVGSVVPDPAEATGVTFAPTVIGLSAANTSVTTTQTWDTWIEFEAGSEYLITLSGPSATNPKARVVLRFLEDQNG